MTSVGVRSSALLEPERTMTIVHLPEPALRPGFGVHLTLDGYGGCQRLLGDGSTSWPASTAAGAARHAQDRRAGPGRAGRPSPKDPGGVSGFVMIAESHISIHTFPLRGFVSADVYTCQNSLDTDRICQYFAEAFALQDLEINVVRRGTRYPQRNIYEFAQKVA